MVVTFDEGLCLSATVMSEAAVSLGDTMVDGMLTVVESSSPNGGKGGGGAVATQLRVSVWLSSSAQISCSSANALKMGPPPDMKAGPCWLKRRMQVVF